MGSGSSKAYNNNNRTPPSPNTNNFPVQSNPKFQTNGNQHSNEWSNQNDMPYSQQFNNNNNLAPNRAFNRDSYSHYRGPQPERNFNPNVMPLTPMEIEEYRRQGIQFPPYDHSRIPQSNLL